MAYEKRMLIDGELHSGAQVFEVLNPATEEVVGTCFDATANDMERAIVAARRAQDNTDWATNLELRKRCILQLQEALEAEQEEMRAELIAEAGCPLLTTYGPQLDVPLRDTLRWSAEMVDKFQWSRSLPETDSFGLGYQTQREVWKEPVGVVGVILPWNFPFELIVSKLGPVLAMGNSCVIKPAPDTPFNANRIGRLIAEKTDIPAGVVNIVSSSNHLLGEVISTSPLVDMVAFTGSTATGRKIMQAASGTLKKVFLELGGKSAYVVLDDADFASAVPGAAYVCMHAGQGCAMNTRMLVPFSRYDEAVELITAGFAGVVYGDPTEPETLQGPQISAKQRDRVLGYINTGVAEGARLVTGGGIPSQFEKGFYVEPTLFVDVDNSMTIAQEEIFGPVLSVIGYKDDDHAVAIANDSKYGLAGSIVSADIDRAKGLAKRIRTGQLGINGGVAYGPDSPFGGYKGSGIGRQGGIEGLELYTESKTVGWPAGV